LEERREDSSLEDRKKDTAKEGGAREDLVRWKEVSKENK
jgi:hypothetical protein